MEHVFPPIKTNFPRFDFFFFAFSLAFSFVFSFSFVFFVSFAIFLTSSFYFLLSLDIKFFQSFQQHEN